MPRRTTADPTPRLMTWPASATALPLALVRE